MIFHESIQNKVEDLINPFFKDMAVELIELNVYKRNNTFIIDVIADKAQGGITIDQCTEINKFISSEIEEEQMISEDYVVEVSSPGLDRPLKSKKDFLRAIGKNVRLHLTEAVSNKREHHGIIEDVEDENVVIKSQGKSSHRKQKNMQQGNDANNNRILIPLEYIEKAVQEV